MPMIFPPGYFLGKGSRRRLSGSRGREPAIVERMLNLKDQGQISGSDVQEMSYDLGQIISIS